MPVGIRDPHYPMDPSRPNDPLHGVTLKAMLVELEAHHGWQELGRRLPIRCFQHDPSISSSLAFLRRTEWARARVEGLYLDLLAERRRSAR